MPESFLPLDLSRRSVYPFAGVLPRRQLKPHVHWTAAVEVHSVRMPRMRQNARVYARRVFYRPRIRSHLREGQLTQEFPQYSKLAAQSRTAAARTVLLGVRPILVPGGEGIIQAVERG